MENLTMGKINEYVKGLTNNAEIEVFNTLDMDDINCVFNYGCVSGVSGFTWYSETEAFFNKYAAEILELLEELKQECGSHIFNHIEFTKNNLTWLFVEETVKRMVYELDCE
mgnify:CR=1 FL=1